jgi:hypothetical protein
MQSDDRQHNVAAEVIQSFLAEASFPSRIRPIDILEALREQLEHIEAIK